MLSTRLSYEGVEELCTGEGSSGLIFYFGYISELLFTEFFPGLFALDRQFIELFQKDDVLKESFVSSVRPLNINDSNQDLNIAILDKNETEDFSDVITREKSMRMRNTWRKLDISRAEVSELNLRPTPYSRPLGLGPCYLGKFKKYPIRVRQIPLQNVSDFVLRKVPGEIKFWKNARDTYIEHYIGFIQDEKSLFIISEADHSLDTLTNFVADRGSNLNLPTKIKIMTMIARVMMNLQKQEAVYVHGHLCPNNILVKN